MDEIRKVKRIEKQIAVTNSKKTIAAMVPCSRFN